MGIAFVVFTNCKGLDISPREFTQEILKTTLSKRLRSLGSIFKEQAIMVDSSSYFHF